MMELVNILHKALLLLLTILTKMQIIFFQTLKVFFSYFTYLLDQKGINSSNCIRDPELQLHIIPDYVLNEYLELCQFEYVVLSK